MCQRRRVVSIYGSRSGPSPTLSRPTAQLRRYNPRPSQRTISRTSAGTIVSGSKTPDEWDWSDVKEEACWRSLTIETIGRATSASEMTSRSNPVDLDGSYDGLCALTVTIAVRAVAADATTRTAGGCCPCFGTNLPLVPTRHFDLAFEQLAAPCAPAGRPER